ncbi:MAG: arylsulfatase [Verrucomicrobiota bacterium]
MNPRPFTFIGFALAALLLPSSPILAEETAPPNVLLIMVDDMGFSDLGCYGGEIDTPHLDQLASSGLRFSQFYNTGRCWPTRAALMTGRYPHEAGHAMTYGDKSPHRAYQGTSPDLGLMIPEVLNPAGYRSYHVGKWHLDSRSRNRNAPDTSPEARGFHRSYKIQTQHNFFNPWKIIDEGTLVERPAGDNPMGNGEYYLTDDLSEKTVAYIKDHTTSHPDQPFFLYLAHTAPHFPLHARQKDIDRHLKRYRAGWDTIRKQRFKELKEQGLIPKETKFPPRDPDAVPWDSLSKEEQEKWATHMAIHAAMIYRVDQGIGQIVQTLKELNQLDNTLILFLSDNGASAEYLIRGDGHDPDAPAGSGASYLCLEVGWSNAANTPFRMHKMWTHEGGIATPLIAHWPAGLGQQDISHAQGHVVDVLPTQMELADAPHPENAPPVSGRSLAPVFFKKEMPNPEFLFWEHTGNKAIRVDDWKLVGEFGKPWELYNLAIDRAETKNLIDQHPEKAKALKKLYHEQADAQGVVDWSTLPGSKSKPSDDYRKK